MYPDRFCIVLLLVMQLLTVTLKAQNFSVDIAAIRNHSLQLHGANASLFYHFTKHLSAGIEVNRFFGAQKIKLGEMVRLSAWDFDLNIHYYLPASRQIILYPVLGISYSREKETKLNGTELHHLSYVNTGAGILFGNRIVKPHIEFILANGRKTEQLVIAGLNIELGKEK